MTRKPLPKAITRSLEDVHVIGGGVMADEPGTYARHFDPVEPEPAPHHHPRPRTEPGPEADARPPLSPSAQAFAARRYKLARQIVDRHKTYAALSGLSPIPVANVAGITARFTACRSTRTAPAP
jgi:hypothetical protein